MSDITLINDSEQSSLVTNGLAKNGEMYLKKEGSTDAGSIVVYDSGAWKTFANEYVAPNLNASELHYSGGLFTSAAAPFYVSAQPLMHFDAAILDGSDSANNPSSGSAVSVWGDRSGQATTYDLNQGTGSKQALFDTQTEGRNSLAFSIYDSYPLSTTYTGASGGDYTAVYVAKIPGATNGDIKYAPLNNGNNASTIWFNASLFSVDLVHGSTSRGFTSTSTQMPTVFNPLHLFIIQRSSSTVTAYTGGNNQQFSHSSVSNAATISNFGYISSYPTEGNIFEVMFFDSALSTANLNVITNYVANKYGISTNSF